LVVALAEALHKPGNKVTLRRLRGTRRVTRFANVEKLKVGKIGQAFHLSFSASSQISDVGGHCWRTKMLVPWWKARNLKSCKLNYKKAAGISPRLRQGND